MHDALEDVCDRLLRTDARAESGGTPATLIITIDIEDLLTGTGYGITSDGTLIRTEQVRDPDRSSRGLLRVPGPQRRPTEPRPDPADRHPRPIRRADRPRRRLLLSGLRPSPRVVRATSRHSLDRRRRTN